MGAQGAGGRRARTAGAGLGHSTYGDRSVAANTAKARQGQARTHRIVAVSCEDAATLRPAPRASANGHLRAQRAQEPR